ncbi:response regulator [Terrilactibacillus sp. S3-3]|nr:response regulator [Terrilactibacillus sp. S3-3]
MLMPKIKGQELVKLIKEFDHDAKIVVISADVQTSVREEMEKEGILTFVNKPLNETKTRQLCDLIRNDSK